METKRIHWCDNIYGVSMKIITRFIDSESEAQPEKMWQIYMYGVVQLFSVFELFLNALWSKLSSTVVSFYT